MTTVRDFLSNPKPLMMDPDDYAPPRAFVMPEYYARTFAGPAEIAPPPRYRWWQGVCGVLPFPFLVRPRNSTAQN